MGDAENGRAGDAARGQPAVDAGRLERGQMGRVVSGSSPAGRNPWRRQPKYLWQSGWNLQHNRLLQAASAMDGIPLFLSGDLHALAEGRILRYGNLDLRRNPVVTVLTGPISTGPKAWPSAWRGTPPKTPSGIEVDAGLNPLKRTAFPSSSSPRTGSKGRCSAGKWTSRNSAWMH